MFNGSRRRARGSVRHKQTSRQAVVEFSAEGIAGEGSQNFCRRCPGLTDFKDTFDAVLIDVLAWGAGQFGREPQPRSLSIWSLSWTDNVVSQIARAGDTSVGRLSIGDASDEATEEEFADNAFVYASAQVLRLGEREDVWHTDGGASLLHAGLTLFGTRSLLASMQETE